jgi:hypothetical protein
MPSGNVSEPTVYVFDMRYLRNLKPLICSTTDQRREHRLEEAGACQKHQH